MGIFANSDLRESYEYTPDYLSDVEVRRFDNGASIMECCLTSLMESEIQWNDMLNQMAAREYSVLESTGAEMIYEKADIKGFFNKVVQWFKDRAADIMGIFTKFLNAVKSKMKNDAKFIHDNKADILKGARKGTKIEVTNYEFNNLDSSANVYHTIMNKAKDITDTECGGNILNFIQSNVVDKAEDNQSTKDYVAALKKGKNDVLDRERGEMVGKDSVSSSDFASAAREYLYGKKFDDVNMSVTIANNMMDEVEKTKQTQNVCKVAYNSMKVSINGAIKTVQNMSNQIIKKDNEDNKYIVSAAHIYTGILQATSNIAHQFLGIQLTAIAARNNQYRKILSKVAAEGRKNSSTRSGDENLGESFFDTESGNDLLFM